MKIGNSLEGIKPDKPESIGPTANRAGSGSDAPVSPTEATDRIDLSAQSRSLGSVKSPSAGDEVRPEKVREVKDALERGDYQVNAHKVAEKMIIESAQLLETITAPQSENGKPVNGDAGSTAK